MSPCAYESFCVTRYKDFEISDTLKRKVIVIVVFVSMLAKANLQPDILC